MPTLLILLLVLPVATAALVAVLGPGRACAVRWLSLVCTLACLVIAAIACLDFAVDRVNSPPTAAASTFTAAYATRIDIVSFGGDRVAPIQFYVGLDGINVWLVLLTALLMVPAVLCSWNAITDRVHEFYAWLLALETAMIGVFLSFDIFLFYVFFELTLVPLFFLIGIWGGPERQYAARKFFVYTLAGSLITLLGVIGLVLTLGNDVEAAQARTTFAIPELVTQSNAHSRSLAKEAVMAREEAARDSENKDAKAAQVRAEEQQSYWRTVQRWVFLALMAGFAIKVPLVPFHTWLPLAHVEAPTAGSVLLAGVLLKIGAYGFLRLCLPLVPDASLAVGAPLIGWLAVVGIIYGSFCSLAQPDLKKLVAYSSVAHLGLCMLGLFALNETGLSGGLLQMINHGLSTGALFLLVGMLYERYHTRIMADYSGMAARLKLLGAAMVFITMSSVGLPGLNGFVGELLVLMGIYSSQNATVAGRTLAVLGAFGMVLSAWYMLTMLRLVFFGPPREPPHEGHGHITDLNGREIATLVPLAALCLFLGIYSKPFLETTRPELRFVADLAQQARERAALPDEEPSRPVAVTAANGE